MVPLVSTSTDIGLPENSVDIMVTINTRMDIFFSTESDHSHDDTLCASTKRALKPTAVLHHLEPSDIDALGPKELDRQLRENYLYCGLKLKGHEAVMINNGSYLHWSASFEGTSSLWWMATEQCFSRGWL